MVVDGIFDLEAMFLHLIGFGLGVVLQVVSFLVAGLFLRGIPRWRRFGNWLLLASPLTLLLVVLHFLTFDPAGSGANEGIAGLTQRLLLVELHTWFVAMGWLAFRRSCARGVGAVAGTTIIGTRGRFAMTSSGSRGAKLSERTYDVCPVGRVESSLTDRAAAPKQGDEEAPMARVVLRPEYCEAAADLRIGDEVLVLTWLHQGRRDVLSVHPRDDQNRPRLGVFSTRSPDRPNPIGLHRVTIAGKGENTVTVHNLEAIDGTPVVDVKPVLGAPHER